MNTLTLQNVRLIDPHNDLDKLSDVYIEGSTIAAIGERPQGFEPGQVFDANGLATTPGLIDCYARLREPGYEKKTTIAAEAKAALYNGITSIVCSPDTDPVIDEVATVELIKRRASDAGFARVLPLAALTRELDGQRLSELATLTSAGCIGATQADHPITDTLVIRRAMEYARTFDIVLVFAPQDHWLRADGCVHEGRVATRLGLPGIPVAAETVALSMLLELAGPIGNRIHFSRITSARGAELIDDAKQRGMPITADTSINHLFYTEQDVRDFDSNYHNVAPYRSSADRDALRKALKKGTLDAVCSDHAPHERDAKLAPFPATEPGLSSFDTFLPLLLRWGAEESLSLSRTLAPATVGPARVFDLPGGRVERDAPADLVLFDPNATRQLDSESIFSRGRNTPRLGELLQGAVRAVCIDGMLHQAE